MACVPAPLTKALGRLFGRGRGNQDMTPMPVERPFLTVAEIRQRDAGNAGPVVQEEHGPATQASALFLASMQDHSGPAGDADEVATSAWDEPLPEEGKGLCPYCNFVVTKGQERIKLSGGANEGRYAHMACAERVRRAESGAKGGGGRGEVRGVCAWCKEEVLNTEERVKLKNDRMCHAECAFQIRMDQQAKKAYRRGLGSRGQDPRDYGWAGNRGGRQHNNTPLDSSTPGTATPLTEDGSYRPPGRWAHNTPMGSGMGTPGDMTPMGRYSPPGSFAKSRAFMNGKQGRNHTSSPMTDTPMSASPGDDISLIHSPDGSRMSHMVRPGSIGSNPLLDRSGNGSDISGTPLGLGSLEEYDEMAGHLAGVGGMDGEGSDVAGRRRPPPIVTAPSRNRSRGPMPPKRPDIASSRGTGGEPSPGLMAEVLEGSPWNESKTPGDFSYFESPQRGNGAAAGTGAYVVTSSNGSSPLAAARHHGAAAGTASFVVDASNGSPLAASASRAAHHHGAAAGTGPFRVNSSSGSPEHDTMTMEAKFMGLHE